MIRFFCPKLKRQTSVITVILSLGIKYSMPDPICGKFLLGLSHMAGAVDDSTVNIVVVIIIIEAATWVITCN